MTVRTLDYNDKIIFRRDGQNSDPCEILEFTANGETAEKTTEIRLKLASADSANNTVEIDEIYIFDQIHDGEPFKVTDFSYTEELATLAVEHQT